MRLANPKAWLACGPPACAGACGALLRGWLCQAFSYMYPELHVMMCGCGARLWVPEEVSVRAIAFNSCYERDRKCNG